MVTKTQENIRLSVLLGSVCSTLKYIQEVIRIIRQAEAWNHMLPVFGIPIPSIKELFSKYIIYERKRKEGRMEEREGEREIERKEKQENEKMKNNTMGRTRDSHIKKI